MQLKQSAESFEVTASLDRVNEELWQKTFPGNAISFCFRV